MVETFFSQLCDQLNLKRNYAKTHEGLATRLTCKLSSMSILQWINYLNGRKLAQIKHALSFKLHKTLLVIFWPSSLTLLQFILVFLNKRLKTRL
jgi:hypothetical protein